jgi:branched-chain amino acid transport system substrate-binding protein
MFKSGSPNKLLIAIGLSSIVLVATLTPTISGGAVAKKKSPITIGVLESLTGATAVYGENNVDGIRLAVKIINNGGGILGHKIDLDIEDDQSSPTEAESVMQSFAGNSSIVAVIGPTSSANAFAADPTANSAKLPVLAPYNNGNGVPQIGPYVHRITAPEAALDSAAANTAVKVDNIHSVALIYASEDPFATSGYQAFLSAFQKDGVTVTSTQAYDATTTVDFTPQLQQIVATHPDALAVAAYGAEGAVIVEQARQAGFTGPIIGNGTFDTPAIYQAAGSAANGLILAVQWSAGQAGQMNAKFVSEYTKEFKLAPTDTSALAYDGVLLIRNAFRKEKKISRSALQSYLEGLKGFSLLGSPVAFTNLGNGERDATTGQPVLLQVENGQLVTVKKP